MDTTKQISTNLSFIEHLHVSTTNDKNIRQIYSNQKTDV